LDLVADLCSDPSAMPAITVTLNGVNQVISSDIYLGPENNDQAGVPWRTIEFAEAFPANIFMLQRKSIEVAGCWGYSFKAPDDVWQAAVQKAALLALPQVAASISRGRVEAQTEHFRYRFADASMAGPLTQQVELWQANIGRVIERYKKVGYF
jgi:hypothetical protein